MCRAAIADLSSFPHARSQAVIAQLDHVTKVEVCDGADGPGAVVAVRAGAVVAVRQEGVPLERAAAAAGVSPMIARRWVREAGGVPPRWAPPSGVRLSLAEREEIAEGRRT
jgi:hypothetical protein